MWMNEYDVEDAVRIYGNDRTPLGEAVRALHSLVVATNCNSDGWPYYRKASDAGRQLQELIKPSGWNPYAGQPHPEVTPEQLKAALKPVKAFRTRRDWRFDITDAERAATAAAEARRAEADRDARVTALAGRFEASLTEALSRDDMSTAEIARMLADMATPGTSQEWIRQRRERAAGASAALADAAREARALNGSQ